MANPEDLLAQLRIPSPDWLRVDTGNDVALTDIVAKDLLTRVAAPPDATLRVIERESGHTSFDEVAFHGRANLALDRISPVQAVQAVQAARWLARGAITAPRRIVSSSVTYGAVNKASDRVVTEAFGVKVVMVARPDDTTNKDAYKRVLKGLHTTDSMSGLVQRLAEYALTDQIPLIGNATYTVGIGRIGNATYTVGIGRIGYMFPSGFHFMGRGVKVDPSYIL